MQGLLLVLAPRDDAVYFFLKSSSPQVLKSSRPSSEEPSLALRVSVRDACVRLFAWMSLCRCCHHGGAWWLHWKTRSARVGLAQARGM